jgi:Cu(I)/Ag(I) efflux system membrane fusion protein
MNMKKTLYIILCLVIFSCSEKKDHQHIDIAQRQKEYTCPMHPSEKSEKPGSCPICGMNLVENKAPTSENASVMLTDDQIKLANIITQKVSPKTLNKQSIVVNARLAVNENQTEVVSSRAAGRIERLLIKETGRYIHQGDLLYELYSESLLTLQKEFLLAKEQQETLNKSYNESILRAATKKLLLYGLTENQIDQLAKTKSVSEKISFFSPVSGVVTQINASEGQYVNEGNLIYNVENMNQLWVEAELYSNELLSIKLGDRVNVTVNGFESNPVKATIIFISPEYQENSQITKVRASLINHNLDFKPGMQAKVTFSMQSHIATSIPVDAVIRNSKSAHVYVQNALNSFQMRIVKTGSEDDENVEIVEGLSDGDIIVTSGAYLLYSDLILKKGINPAME